MLCVKTSQCARITPRCPCLAATVCVCMYPHERTRTPREQGERKVC